MNCQGIEEILKCPICFDFFNVCMLTSCSHNYCSLCIRKYLTYKSQCPLCFEETSEPELRNNRIIDDIVKLYRQKSKDHCAGNHTMVQNLDRDQMQTNNQSTTTDDATNLNLSMEDSSEKAPCPVCDVLVRVTSINAHLDMCLNRDERKESLRRSSTSKRKKLPKVVYHFLSEKELKKLVTESGLNCEGDRQALIKRHKAYLVLYNSECDSLDPKPVSEIAKQIFDDEKLEERLSQRQPGLALDKKMDPELIESKQKAYLIEHQSQFSQLVDNIQQRHIRDTKNSSNVQNKLILPVSSTPLDSPSTSKCDVVDPDPPTEVEKEDVKPKVLNDENNSEQFVNDSASEVSFCETDEMLKDKLSSSIESALHIAPDSDSEAESTASSSIAVIQSKKNLKLSRKAPSEAVPLNDHTPAKRTRHPSDEF